MQTYSFTFIVGDVDPHSPEFEDRFYEAGCDDATLVLMHGAVAACFNRSSGSFKDAVLSAYENILKSGASVERFEPDYLVSAREIAIRAKLTPQAVSLYAKGERGENFPKPKFRVTTANPMWDWVEVSRWLVKRGKIDESEYREAQISRVINFGSQVNMKFSNICQQTEVALAEAV
ncbi:hypothetical protein [Paracoccus sp. KR1-242]|uniref:hypothetical protein n=1 Tax=Paracoccus sp. KR1-242 TaxID=3410028 RepID=UPI003C106E3C